MTPSPPATPADGSPARLPHPERAIFVIGAVLPVAAFLLLLGGPLDATRAGILILMLIPGLAWAALGGAQTRAVVVAAALAALVSAYWLVRLWVPDAPPPLMVESAVAALVALAIESQRRLDSSTRHWAAEQPRMFAFTLVAAGAAIGCFVHGFAMFLAWGLLVTACIRMARKRFTRPAELPPGDATALAVALARARLALLGLAAAALLPVAAQAFGFATRAATSLQYAGYATALLVLAVVAWRFRLVVGAAHAAWLAVFWALVGALQSALCAPLVVVLAPQRAQLFLNVGVFSAAAVLGLALVLRPWTARAAWLAPAVAAVALVAHVLHPLLWNVLPVPAPGALVDFAAWLGVWWLAGPAIARLRDEGLASAFGPTR